MLASPAAKVPADSISVGLYLGCLWSDFGSNMCSRYVRNCVYSLYGLGHSLWLPGTVVPGYDKLFTDSMGPLWTDVRRGYYLRFVIFISCKFAGLDPIRPHLSSGEI